LYECLIALFWARRYHCAARAASPVPSPSNVDTRVDRANVLPSSASGASNATAADVLRSSADRTSSVPRRPARLRTRVQRTPLRHPYRNAAVSQPDIIADIQIGEMAK
jgi:hypothetical protein